MLTQTLDESMAKAKKIERNTKATKYSNVFRAIGIEKTLHNKLSDYKGVVEKNAAQEESLSRFITEDPDIIPVRINYKKSNYSELPFFRSIQQKLKKLYPIKA